ncbi:hypothetical protein ES703_120277 [subsurface metagenome]
MVAPVVLMDYSQGFLAIIYYLLLSHFAQGVVNDSVFGFKFVVLITEDGQVAEVFIDRLLLVGLLVFHPLVGNC